MTWFLFTAYSEMWEERDTGGKKNLLSKNGKTEPETKDMVDPQSIHIAENAGVPTPARCAHTSHRTITP